MASIGGDTPTSMKRVIERYFVDDEDDDDRRIGSPSSSSPSSSPQQHRRQQQQQQQQQQQRPPPPPPSPTIVVPPGQRYESPRPSDVLCGRGGRINSHPGNVNFRSIVDSRRSAYLDPTTKKADKAGIAASIVEEIRNGGGGGRFLKEDPAGGGWIEIGDVRAIRKAGQALREAGPEHRMAVVVVAAAAAAAADPLGGGGGGSKSGRTRNVEGGGATTTTTTKAKTKTKTMGTDPPGPRHRPVPPEREGLKKKAVVREEGRGGGGEGRVPDDVILARMRMEYERMRVLQEERSRMMTMERRQHHHHHNHPHHHRRHDRSNDDRSRTTNRSGSSSGSSNRSGGGSHGSGGQGSGGGGGGDATWDVHHEEYLKIQRLLSQRDQLAWLNAQQQQQQQQAAAASSLLGESFRREQYQREEQRQWNPPPPGRVDRSSLNGAYGRQFHPSPAPGGGGCDDQTVFTLASLESRSMDASSLGGFTWNNSNISNNMSASLLGMSGPGVTGNAAVVGGGVGTNVSNNGHNNYNNYNNYDDNNNNNNNIVQLAAMSHNLGARGTLRGGGGYSRSKDEENKMSHLERKLEEVKERQRRLEQLQDMQRMQQQQAQALLQQQQMSMMPQAQAQAQAMQQMLMLHQVQNRDNCAISSSRRHSQGDLKSSLISLGIDAIEEDELNPGVDADASFKLSNLDFSGMDMSFLSSDPVSIPSSRGGVALPPPNNDFGIDNAKKDRDEDEVDELRRTTTTTTDDKNNCGIDGGVGTFPMKSSDNDKVNHHLQGRSSIPLSVVAEQQTLRRKTTSSIIDDNFNESFKSMEMSDRSLLKNVNTASTESGVVIVGEQKQRGRLPDPDGDILLASGGREERGGRLLGTIHSSRAPSSATADGTAAASTSANNARLSSERTRQRDDPIRRRSNDSMAISDPDFGVSFTSIKSFQSSSRSNDSNSSSHWLSHYKSIDSIDDGQFDPWDEEDVVLSSHHNSHHNSSDGSMSIISAPRMVKTAGGNH